MAQKTFTVMANLFLLTVARRTLYHYDVSFERKRSARGRDSGVGVCRYHLAIVT